MRNAPPGRLSRLLLILALVASVSIACDDDEQPTSSGLFGTANAPDLIVGSDKSPVGMTLSQGSSGAVTVQQLTPDIDRAEALATIGARAGYLNHFDAARVSREKGLNADLLLSWALIFPDEGAATQALENMRTVPELTRSGVRVREAIGLGPGAFVQYSQVDGTSSAAFFWQVRNAVVALEARGAEDPDADRLQSLARTLAKRGDRVNPSDDELPLPGRVEVASNVLDEDFQGERDWALPDKSAGVPLSRYIEGGMLVAIDGPGARWEDTSAIEGGKLDSIDDGVFEVWAEHVEGESARWGVMCRVVEEAGFYLFVVGRDGFTGIFSSLGPSEPLEPIAEVRTHPVVKDAVAAGPHHLRASCVGDPIAELSLEVNDVPVLEAFDDDPRTSGAAGMWIESRDDPASVLFDDLVVSEAVER